MLIPNFRKLARNFLRRKALLIAEAGYEAIGINKSVSQRIKNKNGILKISLTTARVDKEKTLKIDLNKFSRIFVIGIGKGSALACNALAKILGPRLSSGIVLDIQKPKQQTINYKLQFFVGTHPLPSNQNIFATHTRLPAFRPRSPPCRPDR